MGLKRDGRKAEMKLIDLPEVARLVPEKKECICLKIHNEDPIWGCECGAKAYNFAIDSLTPLLSLEVEVNYGKVKDVLLKSDLDYHKLACADEEYMDWLSHMAFAVASSNVIEIRSK